MEGLEDDLFNGYQIILKLLNDKDTINDINSFNKIVDKEENEEELKLDGKIGEYIKYDKEIEKIRVV